METFAGLPVAARDEDTVVVVKPAGVAAEMRADPGRRSVLGRVIADEWPDARLPHRLDKVTSGLQVVCRDVVAVERHNEDLREGRWEKTYVVRVDRRAARGLTLGQHQRYLKRQGRAATVVRSGGQPARLRIEVVADDPERSDLAQVVVALETGRYHQIRAMFADLGAPLVGDERYGGRPDRRGPWLSHVRLDGVRLDRIVTSVSVGRAPAFLHADAVREWVWTDTPA